MLGAVCKYLYFRLQRNLAVTAVVTMLLTVIVMIKNYTDLSSSACYSVCERCRTLLLGPISSQNYRTLGLDFACLFCEAARKKDAVSLFDRLLHFFHVTVSKKEAVQVQRRNALEYQSGRAVGANNGHLVCHLDS